eukprot:6027627-Pyramimonas_sp.AAC.1
MAQDIGIRSQGQALAAQGLGPSSPSPWQWPWSPDIGPTALGEGFRAYGLGQRGVGFRTSGSGNIGLKASGVRRISSGGGLEV